ncbi:hypothetical protein B0A49_10502 [Cryomyces minteri]|uniref:UBC core domain-containing protein n=1 Tax=Cryomyces minteri TaxID=331657 RepID=A0A4U0WRF1_9PEZI|nr:hypothetical protein B0A49_10502 [Cryomyces minteri]
MSVTALLGLVSRVLIKSVGDRDGDVDMPDSQSLHADLDDERDCFSESDEDEEDDWGFDRHTPESSLDASHYTVPAHSSNSLAAASRKARIRKDLQAAKKAGFKVGHQGALLDGTSCFVSISCRISKLGISEEAMGAWQLESSDYLILLIHYPNGYRTVESLKGYDPPTVRQNVELRVGKSTTYKPTLAEALKAFTTVLKDEEPKRNTMVIDLATPEKDGFRHVFISRPLHELLNDRLVTLLNYRDMGMSWEGAERFYNDNQGRSIKHADTMGDAYTSDEVPNRTLPDLVTADQIKDDLGSTSHSFPLLGMQFLLRHFVRCTEFCLVCHTKLEQEFEALKPYVCNKPLCLYQYMSLGFGPSIEHEIVAQPYVVDLLLTFAYASAKAGKMREFPTGLGLSVPPVLSQSPVYGAPSTLPVSSFAYAKLIDEDPGLVHSMRFDRAKLEMIFNPGLAACPVKAGDWIVVKTFDGMQGVLHCRISEVNYFPVVKVSQPAFFAFIQDPHPAPKAAAMSTPNSAVITSGWCPAVFQIYDQNFDDLSMSSKRRCVTQLLDTLPNVQAMSDYLVRKHPVNLKSWADRISPAALGILRWIIASNRSCIIQIDDLGTGTAFPSKGCSRQRLEGMSDWVQFKFAMGAPDKEKRFIDSVRSVGTRLKLKYPTLFAWHGSNLQNWHTIIREGLHFNDIAHGRSYGHGCYHSLDYTTSFGYTHSHVDKSVEGWGQSLLKISSAICLNEIVNAPGEFVSKSPHLVIAQLDWIQTRYLFVRCTGSLKANSGNEGIVEPLEQDPLMTPRGDRGSSVVIPVTAVSRSRRPPVRALKTGSKKVKIVDTIHSSTDADDDDDALSVVTDVSDLGIFIDAANVPPSPAASDSTVEKSKRPSLFGRLNESMKPFILSKLKTDFIPGSLDHSKLPIMQEPSYATSGATQRLMQDFKSLCKIQKDTPLHELGWYINPENLSNVYQWIVELHSFDPHLLLAVDMKKQGIKSVVLELRFGKDYPMSPPFVRVIRPRFLSFMAGGGGHVTAGGALCMELLTNSGWSAANTVEAVLLQVRLAISSTEPRPAQLDKGRAKDYGIGEAAEAYIRACNTHGWAVPPGIHELVHGAVPVGSGVNPHDPIMID